MSFHYPIGGGGGGGTIGGSIATNQVAFGSAANTISGSNNLTWVNSTGILSASFGGNGTFLVNPSAGTFDLGFYTGGGNGMALRITDGTSFYFQADSGKRLLFDLAAKTYQYGDIDSQDNSSILTVDDSASLFTYSTGGSTYLSIDNTFMFMGDDGTFGNDTNLAINDAARQIVLTTAKTFRVADTGGNRFMNVDTATGVTIIGDTNAVFTGATVALNTATGVALSSGFTWDFGATNIQNVLDPVLAQDAATKAYVDSLAIGLAWKAVVMAATTAALPAVLYVNGVAGVGATLTAVAPGVLTIDGYVVQLNDRVLIKDQVAGLQNGIYTLTTVGTGGIAFILTRATDNDATGDQTLAATAVVGGTTNVNTAWTQIIPQPIVMGTTALSWNQFLNVIYTAGAGITLTGHSFSLDVTHANIWTGQQSFSTGDFKLLGSTSGQLGMDTSAITASYVIVWPSAQGGANTVVTNTGGGVLAWRSPSFGLIEEIDFEDTTTGIAAQTYTLSCYAQYGYTIDLLKIIAGGGTCTAAVKINGTSVTGISAIAVSTTIATGTASAANTVVAGDIVTLVITAPTSLNNLQASIKTTRT